jgi:hypothetical protein
MPKFSGLGRGTPDPVRRHQHSRKHGGEQDRGVIWTRLLIRHSLPGNTRTTYKGELARVTRSEICKSIPEQRPGFLALLDIRSQQ